jgi:hypothetical protein
MRQYLAGRIGFSVHVALLSSYPEQLQAAILEQWVLSPKADVSRGSFPKVVTALAEMHRGRETAC